MATSTPRPRGQEISSRDTAAVTRAARAASCSATVQLRAEVMAVSEVAMLSTVPDPCR